MINFNTSEENKKLEHEEGSELKEKDYNPRSSTGIYVGDTGKYSL